MSVRVTLIGRLAERRKVVVPLVAALVVNVLVYVLAVYPLAQRVANIEERDRLAEQTLAEARRDHEAARGTLTGKERASAELATFYREVLPADLAGARRLAYPRLAQLAKQSGLVLERWTFNTEPLKDSSLTRAKVELVLSGAYSGMRTFIHQLESASEFLVLDDVGLAEGGEASGTLVLTLGLSTYYRGAPAQP